MARVAREAKAAIATLSLPRGIVASVSSTADAAASARNQLVFNCAIAALAAVVLLLLAFGDGRSVGLVLCSAPVALLGGILALPLAAAACRSVPSWASSAVDDACVLTRSDVPAGITAAWEQPIIRPSTAEVEPLRKRFPRWLCDFEGYGSPGLLLDDSGALSNDASVGDIGEPQLDEVAAPEFCVQRRVEHRQIPN